MVANWPDDQVRPEPRLVLTYRGGWSLEHYAGPDGWDRVAVRDGRRVEQGGRTYAEFLDALDRIDGRSVLRDFLDGLDLGMTKEDASRPLPCDEQGRPKRGGQVQPDASQAQPEAVPVQPPAPSAGFDPGLQLSLFDSL